MHGACPFCPSDDAECKAAAGDYCPISERFPGLSSRCLRSAQTLGVEQANNTQSSWSISHLFSKAAMLSSPGLGLPALLGNTFLCISSSSVSTVRSMTSTMLQVQRVDLLLEPSTIHLRCEGLIWVLLSSPQLLPEQKGLFEATCPAGCSPDAVLTLVPDARRLIKIRLQCLCRQYMTQNSHRPHHLSSPAAVQLLASVHAVLSDLV